MCITLVLLLVSINVFYMVVDASKEERGGNKRFLGGVMDSDWPMLCHDNQGTGRGPYALHGNLPVLKWKFRPEPFEGNIYGSANSPVIDKDGTVYMGYSQVGDYDNFFAVNPDGSLK